MKVVADGLRLARARTEGEERTDSLGLLSDLHMNIMAQAYTAH